MENKSTKTILFGYITFLQSLGIVLVVLGHSLNFFPEIMPIWAKITERFVYSFHMPLFFFISGFLFSYSLFRKNGEIALNDFVKKKLKRLFIPYFAVGTIIYLLKILVFNQFVVKKIEFSLQYYISSTILYPTHNPASCLWFLPTLFCVSLAAYIISKHIQIKPLLLIAFIVANLSYIYFINLFNISGILYYLLFFVFGMYIFSIKDKIKLLQKPVSFVFMLLLFIVCLYLTTIRFAVFNRFIAIVTASLGILISLSAALYFSGKNIKFFYGIIDGYYYQIYLLAWFGQCGMRTLYQLHILNYETTMALMFVSGIVIPLIITKIIIKYFPKFKICIGK